MNTLKSIYALLAVLAFAACSKTPAGVELKGVSAKDYDGTTVKLSGEAQSFSISLSGNGWEATSPSSDTWLSCVKNSDSEATVYVSVNNGSQPRHSHIRILGGEETVTLEIEQDYRRYFTVYAEDYAIDADAGTYRIAASTNLLPGELVLSSTETWLDSLKAEDGWLSFIAEANTGSLRSATISISSPQVSTSVKISQLAGGGKSYLISISALNLAQWPVYEAKDPDSGESVAYICKEYLYKTSPQDGSAMIDGSYVVVYPFFGGEPDYTRGFISDNGGFACWNASADAYTPGNEILARAQTGTSQFATAVYLRSGTSTFRAVEGSSPEYESATIAVCSPVKLSDSRSGAADTAGNVSEEFEYGVVKIGMQFWINSNFASSRQRDGTPIATGLNSEQWAAGMNPVMQPMCLVAGTGESTTYFDANDPEAAATRKEYGCLYNLAAIAGRQISFPTNAKADYNGEDGLAPAGWAVPSRADFIQLLNYVIQKDIRSTGKENYTNEMLEKLQASKGNITGFSAKGSRGRAATGLFGGVPYYLTTDYHYAFNSNTITSLRFLTNSYEPMYDITVFYGAYVRLVKR